MVVCLMRRALITLELPSRELAQIVYSSISPELKTQPSPHVRATATLKGKYITFLFEAKSTAGVRALINSYLRWVDMVLKLIQELEV
ncbi:MAG: hypothetical protein DRJ33_07580 [Candidatus Methanomethylicota archaeon]|uniref:KEOPS complex Pcc1-like subunit n=1 Tax=Thermoproteota archaeon TaxID=2056631 RepID=A0A497ETK0_9CREN|nr:MAG: hypothetical protein DRJ33_07580 [Candidatus Verstraetearchaeota archaeon]